MRKFRSKVESNGSEIILPDPNYALPSGTNADGSQKSIVTLPQYRVTNMDGSVDEGPLNVVIGDVYDGYAFGHRTGKILATTSLLDKHLFEAQRSRVFAVNGAVFEDNYSILLPRAVSFSAGIINHFFAGQLGLRRASSGSGWIIDNFGAEAMNGNFSLYRENASQQRAIVPSGVWGGSLAVGQSTPTLPEPPSGTTKLIAVFNGTIGSETSLNRVAGKSSIMVLRPVASSKRSEFQARSPCGRRTARARGSFALTVRYRASTRIHTISIRRPWAAAKCE